MIKFQIFYSSFSHRFLFIVLFPVGILLLFLLCHLWFRIGIFIGAYDKTREPKARSLLYHGTYHYSFAIYTYARISQELKMLAGLPYILTGFRRKRWLQFCAKKFSKCLLVQVTFLYHLHKSTDFCKNWN